MRTNKKMPFYLFLLLFMINLVICKVTVDKTKEFESKNLSLKSNLETLKNDYKKLKTQNDKLAKNYSDINKKLN